MSEKIRKVIEENPIDKCESCKEELFRRWPFTGYSSNIARDCACEREKKLLTVTF